MRESWQELRLTLPSALEVAIRVLGDPQMPPVLALHGWQDNAATFAKLGPLLSEHFIVALDFPGHGWSARRPLSTQYYIWSYVAEIRAVVEHFGWQHFYLLGHSMGGAVACLYAALYPAELTKMILLDAVGPLATEPAKLPAQMRSALDELDSLKARQRNYYQDFQAAVQARADKGLSVEAAQLLGERGIVCDEKGCYWNLDPRLRILNPLSLSEEQVAAFMQAMSCPILLILGFDFWPTRQEFLQRRLQYLPQAQIHHLPGGHHQHMEGQVERVAELIRKFLAD
jgi:pimeloyl-ACP methyl ester carboxylesterase